MVGRRNAKMLHFWLVPTWRATVLLPVFLLPWFKLRPAPMAVENGVERHHKVSENVWCIQNMFWSFHGLGRFSINLLFLESEGLTTNYALKGVMAWKSAIEILPAWMVDRVSQNMTEIDGDPRRLARVGKKSLPPISATPANSHWCRNKITNSIK